MIALQSSYRQHLSSMEELESWSDLTKHIHFHGLSSPESSLMTKDVLPMTASRTLVVAHVLNNAQQGHFDLPEYVGTSACIYQCNVL